MQLYLSPTSPFARKLRVALLEKGLDFATVFVDPWQVPEALTRANPLSQVPTLVTDAGVALVNSETILDWLERTYPQPALLPADADAATRALAIAGLAQGMLEATVQIVLERRRAPELQSAALIERRKAALQRGVASLAQRFDRARDRFHVDGIGAAVALAYLDFRLPEHAWRNDAPQLAAWQDWAAARPSLQASAPPT